MPELWRKGDPHRGVAARTPELIATPATAGVAPSLVGRRAERPLGMANRSIGCHAPSGRSRCP
jgi:hypothetical protein